MFELVSLRRDGYFSNNSWTPACRPSVDIPELCSEPLQDSSDAPLQMGHVVRHEKMECTVPSGQSYVELRALPID